MSPRPPPKISLRHDWTKEFGSKVDRQPEGEVARQPIDRSGQPDNKHEVFVDTGGKNWSQEIKEKSSHEELSSDRSGRPGITQDVISVQACSSEDSKSLNVEQTHDRSGRPGKDTVEVQDDPEVYQEAETLNINDETIRDRIEADMDLKIPGLPHSNMKHAQSASVRELMQKIENHPMRPTTESIIQSFVQNQNK